MSYGSTFESNFDGRKVEIGDLGKLNSEIGKLDGGMSTARIVKDSYVYGLEMDDNCGSFSDDKKFAEILSRHLIKGKIILSYVGEQGDKWGYLVLPNKVVELAYIAVPANLFKQVSDYIESLTNTK